MASVTRLDLESIGRWTPGAEEPAFEGEALLRGLARVREPMHVVRDGASGRVGIAAGGQVSQSTNGVATHPLLATLPALYPEWLGDRAFCEAHGVRFPYVTGAMANGIATTRLVIAMARHGMMGFFGSAGLGHDRIEAAIDELQAALDPEGLPYGVNLIHSPNEPELEAGTVDLFLRRGVRRVSSSAYMELNPTVVRYACTGLTRDPQGRIRRRNHLFPKVSRPEVARHFMAPPPAELLRGLVERGQLTRDEADLALLVPLAEDLTIECDSGGHTDNQPMPALFPTMVRLRDDLCEQHGYPGTIRLGAAGGLGAPSAVAAAFGLGAAYVLTGSVNQACIESGLSDAGRALLAEVALGDVIMAPAADMFEMGVKVQVLKRGTLFASRGAKLYELYTRYERWPDVPAGEREKVERQVLARPFDDVWADTRAFFLERDPREVERADRDEKHRMALVFRWYLGLSSKWAIHGTPERRLDYQIWCGPAMAAFNAWVAGSFLEAPESRSAPQVALNLLEGAAVVTRAQQLRTYGAPIPGAAFQFRPRRLS